MGLHICMCVWVYIHTHTSSLMERNQCNPSATKWLSELNIGFCYRQVKCSLLGGAVLALWKVLVQSIASLLPLWPLLLGLLRKHWVAGERGWHLICSLDYWEALWYTFIWDKVCFTHIVLLLKGPSIYLFPRLPCSLFQYCFFSFSKFLTIRLTISLCPWLSIDP